MGVGEWVYIENTSDRSLSKLEIEHMQMDSKPISQFCRSYFHWYFGFVSKTGSTKVEKLFKVDYKNEKRPDPDLNPG